MNLKSVLVYIEIEISDLKTFTNKGCKNAVQKSWFLGKFCLTEQDLFGIGAIIHIG